ncbi:MAG TPA: adenylate/guanylate cyclase domain-containing protein, partial [Opitutaceae bacterium]|nr:adenylate/guanylate cyclase domain-containing protein [Opitutaceae bacterium]
MKNAWRINLAIGGIGLVILLALHLSGRSQYIDWAMFDWTEQHPWRQLSAPKNSALVLVDESSLKAIAGDPYASKWPWRRTLFAALIAGLHKAGAQRIAMDFIFLEPSEEAEHDAILAAYSVACPEVVLGGLEGKFPAFWTPDVISRYAGIADRVGLVEAKFDEDNVIRTYTWPKSLADRACVGAGKSRAKTPLLRWYGGLEALRQAGVPVLSAAPFVEVGYNEVLSKISEKHPDYTAEAVSAGLAEIPDLHGDPFDRVRGKVVFVGVNAAGTYSSAYDLVATPVGSKDPGVLVHWTAWADATSGGFIHEVPRSWVLVLAVVLGGAIFAAGWHWPRLGLTVVLASALAVVALGVSYFGVSRGIWLAPASPLAGVGLGLLCITARNFLREQGRKREIQAIFGSYVSAVVVTQLLRDPDAVKLGGEKRDLTVFFSDLAGFTDLSEKMQPEQLVRLVNFYFNETSPFIIDEGGYLDKYIGDAIMGVFGSPEPLANHALSACRAALAYRDHLPRINAELERRGQGVRLVVRIGINTGPMIVGNLGSERKKNYTVIGDAVNLASRLEGANKEFGTHLLIGEETERRVRGELISRPIARLRVKGKQQAVQVHELLGWPARVGDAERAFL